MEQLSNLSNHFDLAETIIIRGTVFVGIVLFCGLYLWSHIRDFRDTNRKKKEEKHD
jgi:hypothetical protein